MEKKDLQVIIGVLRDLHSKPDENITRGELCSILTIFTHYIFEYEEITDAIEKLDKKEPND